MQKIVHLRVERLVSDRSKEALFNWCYERRSWGFYIVAVALVAAAVIWIVGSYPPPAW